VNSCLYVGRVRHRRFSPREHAFTYRLFLVYLDLDELETVFRKRWLWSARGPAIARFERGDHLGDPARPLDEAVRDLVENETGRRPTGPVRLLTHLRYFGYGFNPVSFYFCFDRGDTRVETIIAEVNNTPWGEQHCYVLDEADNIGSERKKKFLVDKQFHVSPFMDLDMRYRWNLTLPDDRLLVHLQNESHGTRIFDATLLLERRPMTGKSLAAVLLRFPFMTARIVTAIYFEAVRLWLKGIPFHPHPNEKECRKTAVSP